jgi:glycosyltransferase involved in cell wall biosynthesis
MAAGCPVICSDSGSHAEIAGGAAILFDPRNPDDLAEKVRAFLTDAALATKLKLQGLERAQAFTWHTTIERTAAAYMAA